MKLKLSNRERLLFIITAVCLMIVLLYYTVVKPQLDMVSKLESQAKEYSIMIKGIQSKASLDNEVYNEYKNLSDMTRGLLRNYYPEMIQEKVILMIDEKLKHNNLGLVSIAFTEPALTDINTAEAEESAQVSELEDLVKQLYNVNKAVDTKAAKDEAKEEMLEVKKMTVSLSLTGSYSQIYSFLKEIEQQNRSIICSNIILTNSGDANLICDIKLDFYSVPKPFEQDDEYLKWDLSGEYGKASPF